MKNKIILSVAFVAVLFSFGFAGSAKASCIDQNFSQRSRVEQIQCLTSIIIDLQSQLVQLQNQQSTTVWCHTFNTSLGFINSGSDEVISLHTALQKESISYGADDSNTYTEDTAAAIVQFQAKYGIRQTGYVGPITRARLNILYGCSTITPNLTLSPNQNLPIITVTSPNGGETWTKGSLVVINWTSSNIPADHNILTIRLRSSVGREYNLHSYTPNDGVEKVIVPDSLMSGNYTLEIKTIVNGTTVFDASDSYFKIVDAIQPSITVISPNGGETYAINDRITVNWKTTGILSSERLSIIRLRSYSSGKAYDLAYNFLNDGQEVITIPSSVPVGAIPVGAYTLEIEIKSSIVGTSVNVFDASDSYFKIGGVIQPSVTVISPNGGETYESNSKITVNWRTNGMSSSQTLNTISLREYPSGKEYPSSQEYTLARNVINDGQEILIIPPSVPVGAYTLEIKSDVNFDASDSYFKITEPVQPSVTVISPNGGETYESNSKITVNWKTTGMSLSQTLDVIRLRVYPYGQEYNLASNVVNDGQEVIVIPPFVPVGAYTLEIKSSIVGSSVTVFDASDSYFKITEPVQPSVTVISPNGGETYESNSKITVNWKTTGMSLSQTLDVIRLRVYPYGQEYNLASNVVNDGQEVIVIPSSVPFGSYTLEIKSTVVGSGVNVFDASDSYFKIVDSLNL